MHIALAGLNMLATLPGLVGCGWLGWLGWLAGWLAGGICWLAWPGRLAGLAGLDARPVLAGLSLGTLKKLAEFENPVRVFLLFCFVMVHISTKFCYSWFYVCA